MVVRSAIEALSCRRRLAGAASLTMMLLLLGGCGDGAEQTSAEAAGSSTGRGASSSPPLTGETSGSAVATPEPGSRLVVTTRDSDYGRVLFDGRGQAIYLFDKERTSRAECYGDCAFAWPPVLTEGEPRAAGAVQGSLLGTTTRDDGSSQVTYAGHPLYYYVHDDPGQILCHNVNEFGGLWLVVTPTGHAAA